MIVESSNSILITTLLVKKSAKRPEDDEVRGDCNKKIIDSNFNKLRRWLNTLKESIRVTTYLILDAKKTYSI